jgi:DNA-directed RNA polymerase specialized sigma24 family protein
MTEITRQTGAPPAGSDAASAPGLDRTLALGYGLALRILDDRDEATAACEAAYLETAGAPAAAQVWDRAVELRFLGSVRAGAIARKAQRVPPQRSAAAPPTYERSKMVQQCLDAAEPLGRDALELCYFGGLSAREAADVLGQPADRVRSAMRGVLLALGATAREGERQRT